MKRTRIQEQLWRVRAAKEDTWRFRIIQLIELTIAKGIRLHRSRRQIARELRDTYNDTRGPRNKKEPAADALLKLVASQIARGTPVRI